MLFWFFFEFLVFLLLMSSNRLVVNLSKDFMGRKFLLGFEMLKFGFMKWVDIKGGLIMVEKGLWGVFWWLKC